MTIFINPVTSIKEDGILNSIKLIIFSVLFFCFSKVIFASQVIWSIEEDSKIDIRAKYTFGTHELATTQINGHVKEENGKFSGNFVVPIKSIKEGRKTLECHLHEALGLDYDKSGYPEEHVCSKTDELPNYGPDSISFPDIRFQIDNVEQSEDSFLVTGQWTIHGISKTEKIEIKFQEIEPGLKKLQGKLKFNLKDYGVIVKKAFIISVNNEVDVNLDLKLRKKEMK